MKHQTPDSENITVQSSKKSVGGRNKRKTNEKEKGLMDIDNSVVIVGGWKIRGLIGNKIYNKMGKMKG